MEIPGWGRLYEGCYSSAIGEESSDHSFVKKNTLDMFNNIILN